MKIVADDQIPLIDELFADLNLIKKPGQDIQPDDVVNADILWVRTITRVDKKLLAGSTVRFVGSATAGYDHLDTEWLEQNNIAWGYARGANAVAVAEYVLCVIASLQAHNIFPERPLRAGVIGVGKVGQEVVRSLEKIGMQVLQNDPPRAAEDNSFHSTSLSEFKYLDLLCLHPSLTFSGDFPSYHLLGQDFLNQQKPGTVLLNASRGAVLDTHLLLSQSHLHLCLDVWENEPEINLLLLQKALIATPHIAGYSVSAKLRASLLLYQQTKDFFELPERVLSPDFIAKKSDNLIHWRQQALKIFDPLIYTHQMKNFLLEKPQETTKRFLQLRKEYIWRESFL